MTIFSSNKHSGFTLIEVLVTMVIIAIGLLGLAGLQMTSLNNQLEAYQRAQGMLLLDEMSNRIRVNTVGARAGEYVDTSAGNEHGLADPADEVCSDLMPDVAARDVCDWNAALAGAGVSVDGDNLGSIIGARGCIENVTGSSFGEVIIRLTIAWQGLAATKAPASDCGASAFGDDKFRRTASLDVVLANLELP
ncbi:type IV pilus modification protein PilV [marine gamma proteobacterium HTCC2148]|nr:type IV pilus modification protein PilV [marine gamma proteobacterium HTCC2148]